MMQIHLFRRAVMAGMMLGMLLALPALCLAQIENGLIVGTVTDSSGAAVPGATVTITNARTNVSTKLTTSAVGNYELSNLIPGTYTISVEHPGFKKEVQGDITVLVGSPTTVDLKLSVGAVTESVIVSAAATPINTTQADLGTVVTPTAVEDLPLSISLSQRHFESFIFLTPGYTGWTSGSNAGTIVALGGSSVNGLPTFTGALYMDGLPWINNDEGGAWLVHIAYESIDEFKVENNTYAAQYGWGVGMQDYHIRSGTNGVHGDLYEFLRNNVLDSRGFYLPTVSVEKQNEYGGTIGGPVYIPKVYDGRNKTFFAWTWTGYKFRGASRTSLITLPQPAFLNGDFTQLKDANGNLIPIYDPNTTAPDDSGGFTRTQFSCNGVMNEICPDRFSVVTKAFLPLIPTATLPGLINNAEIGVPNNPPIDNKYWVGKIDHNINSSNVIHMSVAKTVDEGGGVSDIPGPLANPLISPTLSWQERFSYDRILTPTLHNTLGIQAMRLEGRQIFPNLDTNLLTPISPLNTAWPAISIAGGFPQFGEGTSPIHSIPQGSGLFDNIDWIKGRNSFHIGADFRWLGETKSANNEWPGSWSFSNLTTSLPDSPNDASWGYGFASFLLGLPAYLNRTSLTGTREYRTDYYGLYLQDDMRLTPKLTVNAGVRWDLPLPSSEKYNRMGGFEPDVPNPGAGGILGATVFEGHATGACAPTGPSLCRDRFADKYYKDFGPRIGFAYRFSDKMVVRAGYGLTYIPAGALEMWDGDTVSSFYTGYRDNQLVNSPDGGTTPIFQWDQGPPPIVVIPPSLVSGNGQSVDFMARNAGRAGYAQQWSLTLERELPGHAVIQASYVGTKGTRITGTMENLNQLNLKYLSLGNLLGEDIYSADARAANIPIPYPGFTGAVSQALRPYPQYPNITDNFQETGNSTYHALQVRAQKYYSNGMSYLVTYVASKTITNTFWGFGGFAAGPLDTANRKLEKAIGSIDMPQELVISGNYQLPIGPSKHFLGTSKGPVGKVLGGWEVGYILNYQSGVPLSITGGPALPDYGGSNRPVQVPGQPIETSRSGKFDPAVDLYLNPAAFTSSAPYTIGNVGPFMPHSRAFPYYNENVDLIKRTTIHESMNLEFRAEFYNLFNRTQFGYPDQNTNDTIGYGTIGGQINAPRIIQFGLKFNF